MKAARAVLVTPVVVVLVIASASWAKKIINDKVTYSFTLSVPGTKQKAKVVVRGNDLTVNGKKIEPKAWPGGWGKLTRRVEFGKKLGIELGNNSLQVDSVNDGEPMFVWVQGPLTVSGLTRVATIRGRPVCRSGPLRLEDGPVTYDYYYSVGLGESKSFLLLDQSGPSPKRMPQTLRDAITTLEVRYEK